MTRPDETTDSPEEPDRIRETRSGFASGLDEADRYFMGEANVQNAARRLATRLAELGIDYAIAGGLAVTAHGHVRTTQDVDVLLTKEGLEKFKAESLGRGWVEKFKGSRGVRDAVHDVPIDVLLSGGFPGDGQPCDLAFPVPDEVIVDSDGIRFLALRALVELKLASGMKAPDRPRDFDDVIQLIRVNTLTEDYATRLHASVQGKYAELWGYSQRPTDEY